MIKSDMHIKIHRNMTCMK